MEPPATPPPDPADDYERNPRTKQGNPLSMRCRLCGDAKVIRRIRYDDATFSLLLYCPSCDHIPLRSKG